MKHVLILVTLSAGLSGLAGHSKALADDAAGTRLDGLERGPYGVGFEVRSGTDRTRRINARDAGARIGVAVWYPAQQAEAGGPAMTALDYRLLDLGRDPSDADRKRRAQDEARALVGWRHIGVVELTKEQALASLATHGIARRGLPAAGGRFPVVLLLGGPFYLSTTAELLASHGFLVAAPFRFGDQSSEVDPSRYTWSVENSVRDAEWALDSLGGHPAADTRFVGALGHGGGGLQALVLAMGNRAIKALANVDAANFSSRSAPGEIPSYSPRLVRAPYLFIATEETRKSLDRFDDFVQMRFCDSFEVVLGNPDLRHHDLSDIGRAVTAPMALRGAAQRGVERDYGATQQMLVRFFRAESESGPAGERAGAFSEWLAKRQGESYRVTVRRGVEPAPTLAAALEDLGADTLPRLRQAQRRDPQAAVFEPDGLARMLGEALANGDFETADALAQFALELHPASPVLQAYRSEALEGRGEIESAIEVARACAATDPAPDWRATVAINACRDRAERLGARTSEPR